MTPKRETYNEAVIRELEAIKDKNPNVNVTFIINVLIYNERTIKYLKGRVRNLLKEKLTNTKP